MYPVKSSDQEYKTNDTFCGILKLVREKICNMCLSGKSEIIYFDMDDGTVCSYFFCYDHQYLFVNCDQHLLVWLYINEKYRCLLANIMWVWGVS